MDESVSYGDLGNVISHPAIADMLVGLTWWLISGVCDVCKSYVIALLKEKRLEISKPN